MDDQLELRLREIQEAAESAAVNASSEFDILPIRNEIEDAEERLSKFMGEIYDALTGRLESNRKAIQRLQNRIDEVAQIVEMIQAEMPAE